METTDTPLEGLLLITLPVHRDARGFFVERFREESFRALIPDARFVQDNHSRSHPNVLRGLHYQHSPAQGKLVGVLRGRVWDVAVDIRPDSPTFGEHYGAELSGENGALLWIPPGFAHGFCVLGDEPADMLYKVTAPYSPQGEGGIRFDDAALGIEWPLSHPIVSARDEALASWAEYRRNPARW